MVRSRTKLHLCNFRLITLLSSATFYSLVYLWLLQRSDIAELTIEDPSEAFQDMRDKVDYRTLTSANVFKDLKAPIPLSYDGKKDWKEETRKEWKLASRQFSRILEMALKKNLMKSAIDLASSEANAGNASPNKRKMKMLDSDEKEYRLLVKERLARMNYEILAPMSRSEKREVLQQVSDSYFNCHAVANNADQRLLRIHRPMRAALTSTYGFSTRWARFKIRLQQSRSFTDVYTIMKWRI